MLRVRLHWFVQQLEGLALWFFFATLPVGFFVADWWTVLEVSFITLVVLMALEVGLRTEG